MVCDQFLPFPTHQSSTVISFEGIEGSGKSTQIQLLKSCWENKNYNVHVYREPGATVFGEHLRSAILNSNCSIDPYAQMHLFMSARAQLITEKVLPICSQKNTLIILDRYMDSTLAYQGSEIAWDQILQIHQYGPLRFQPHKTFLLDIDLETSMQRQQLRGSKKDYFEAKNQQFYQKLIDGYHLCAKSFPERITVINAMKSPELVFKEIYEKIKK